MTDHHAAVSQGLVDLMPSTQDQRCVSCGRATLLMRTYLGRWLTFDANPVDRVFDDGTGWIPGRWPLGPHAQLRTALAPLDFYGVAKRTRARRVMQLHHCPERAAAARISA